jgi:hypothetical protein
MVPVVAGVLGGVALIAAVLGGVLFYMCCKKNNAPALYAGGVSKDAAYVSGIPVAAGKPVRDSLRCLIDADQV